MFLLVAAHPGCPRQNPDSHKTVVVVVAVVDISQKTLAVLRNLIMVSDRTCSISHIMSLSIRIEIGIEISSIV